MDDQNQNNQPVSAPLDITPQDSFPPAPTAVTPNETPLETPAASLPPLPPMPSSPTVSEPVTPEPVALSDVPSETLNTSSVPSWDLPSENKTEETVSPLPPMANESAEPVAAPSWDLPSETPLETPAASLPPLPPMPSSPTVSEPVTPEPVGLSNVPSAPLGAPAEPVMTETNAGNGGGNKKISPILGGVMALMLMVGVAGAAYYVSSQMSSRQAIAPNAPESKPAAATGAACNFWNGDTCTKDFDDGDLCYECISKTTAKGQMKVSNGSCGENTISAPACENLFNKDDAWDASSVCKNEWNNKNKGAITTCKTDTECTSGLSSSCSSGVICKDGKCLSPNTGVSCGSWTWGSYGGLDCDANSRRQYQSCDNGTIKRGNGTNGGKGCTADGDSGGATSCSADKRDTPESNELTFAKDGKVALFSRNFEGTITLKGPKTVTITTTTGGAAIKQSPEFEVKAGETYTITSKIKSESANSYGWIANKSATVCGPVKTPGAAIDGNSKATGKCGGDEDISAVMKMASGSASLSGISAKGKAANVQCWGDMVLNDATQDYDYNDFTLVFGYVGGTSEEVGACNLIKIYKKNGAAYGETPLTAKELNSLTVGDVLKFSLTANMDNLKGRFKVMVNGKEDFYTGTLESDKKTISYSDYKVDKSGIYFFEAQVSTKP